MIGPQRGPASVRQINALVSQAIRQIEDTMKYKLFQGDCLERIKQVDPVKCIFADPPDNINLGYGEYKDKLPDEQYELFLERCVNAFVDKAEIVWLSFNAKWTTAMGSILHHLNPKFYEIKPCVQVFTFGQHNKHDLGNNHRPLWRVMRKGAELYPDAIKVESWRQRNGDPRAAPGGRVPGDVFDMQHPRSRDTICPEDKVKAEFECSMWPGDVMDFPRVTGNSKQRCDWHPTQLHEELVKRCVLLSTSPTDRTLDPFGGTGTTLRVCKALGRPCTLFEFDKTYCLKIAEANGLKVLRTPGGYGC